MGNDRAMGTRVISGTITGGYTLSAKYSELKITPTGLIDGGDYGVIASHKAKIVNDGSIVNSSMVGVELASGGSVVNGSGTNTAALISQGVYILNASGTVTNFGTINAYKNLDGKSAHYNFGVFLDSGGTVHNGSQSDYAAYIGGAGVRITTASGDVRNFGSIEAKSATGVGVYIDSGVVINGSSSNTAAFISGGKYGVSVNSAAATVTNFGTIAGTSGVALKFNSASDRLIVEGGSSFVGAVQGGGGMLEMASGGGTLSGLGTSFSGFGYYVVSSGPAWTLSGTNKLAAGTTLINRGTMSVDGMLSDSGRFTNAGAISGGDGGIAIELTGSGTFANSGVIRGALGGAGGRGGTAVQLTGGYLADGGAIVGGAGGGGHGTGAGGGGGTAVQMTSGGLINRGSVTGGAGGAGGGGGAGGAGGTAVLLAGGDLTNTGAITGGVGGLSGDADYGVGGAGVYLSGRGQLTNKGLVAGGAAGSAGAIADGIIISGAGTVDNFSTISGGAYSVDILGAGGVLMVETGSVLIGAAAGGGGTLDLAGGSGTITGLGATATVSGSEALTCGGFGSYLLNGGGVWTLAGTNSLAAGNTLTDNARVTSAGSLTVAGTISGTGSLTIGGGTATFGVGAALSVASLSLKSGSTTINEALTYGGAFQMGQGATLTLGRNDQLLLSGAANLHGLIAGAGTVTMADGSINGLSIGGASVLIVTGNVLIDAALSVGAGSDAMAAFVIGKNGTVTIEKAVYILNASSTSTIDVEGTFINSDPAATAVQVSTIDMGLIEASAGTFDFANSLTGTGVLTIDSGATLKVDSTVASTLTVHFNGAAATLALSNNAIFAATIADFALGDAIYLVNSTATGASVNAKDQLVIVDTTQGGTQTVATLQLTGDYRGQTFTTKSNGRGGTIVMLASEPNGKNVSATRAEMLPLQTFVASMSGMGPKPFYATPLVSHPLSEIRSTLMSPRIFIA